MRSSSSCSPSLCPRLLLIPAYSLSLLAFEVLLFLIGILLPYYIGESFASTDAQREVILAIFADGILNQKKEMDKEKGGVKRASWNHATSNIKVRSSCACFVIVH